MRKPRENNNITKRNVSKKVIENPILYTITDKHFGELNVKNTANGWWTEKEKLTNLISAFKYDCSIKEACVHAGITIDQYNYFIEIHPEFSNIVDRIRELPTLKARKRIVDDLGENTETAKWYLGKKKRIEFGDDKQQTPIPEGGQLHLHLHNEKILQIVANTEEEVKKQLEESIKVVDVNDQKQQ